jgi:gliding motility-associated-like protein
VLRINEIFRAFTQLFLIVMPISAWSQVAITQVDGSPFSETWCYDDDIHQISGTPTGGVFSGCGVSSVNGRWYFNPAEAGTGQLTFPLLCTVVYTAPNGDTASREIRIHKPVIPDAGGDRAVCSGGMFTLTADMLYAGHYRYSWFPGSGLRNPYAKETGGTVADRQRYVISVVDTLTGCSGTDSLEVRNESVYADIMLDKEYGCVGDSMLMWTTRIDSMLHYRWDMGDGHTEYQSGIQHAYKQAGKYGIQLVVHNDYCTDTARHELEVASLELNGPDRVEPDEHLFLETSAGEPYRITAWRPGRFFPDQTASSQSILPDTTRNYIVIGMSDKGCVDSAELQVIVNPRTMLPTAFTPNGDGRNDWFRLITWGEPSIITNFRVFDRWGKMVFGSAGQIATAGWDGRVDGRPAETGVYYYLIEFDSAGKHISLQGDVTLIR